MRGKGLKGTHELEPFEGLAFRVSDSELESAGLRVRVLLAEGAEAATPARASCCGRCWGSVMRAPPSPTLTRPARVEG